MQGFELSLYHRWIRLTVKSTFRSFMNNFLDSVTGRPNGGEWKTVRDWVSAVIDELHLETRPGISNVAVMQVLIILASNS